MDLWIRSQDRENLIPVNNPICIIDTRVVYKESATYIITLAEYKTKERALEVLDEIQQMLKSETIETETKYIDNQVYETKITRKPLIPKNIVIYEMPKG